MEKFDRMYMNIRRCEGLSPIEKLMIAYVIERYQRAENTNNKLQLSNEYLARELGTSIDTIKRTKKSLKDKGLISWTTSKTSKNELTTSEYKMDKNYINRYFNGEIFTVQGKAQPVSSNTKNNKTRGLLNIRGVKAS